MVVIAGDLEANGGESGEGSVLQASKRIRLTRGEAAFGKMNVASV